MRQSGLGQNQPFGVQNLWFTLHSAQSGRAVHGLRRGRLPDLVGGGGEEGNNNSNLVMKLTINNFGPIHHCEFDLEKDFHLVVGENNVGKSYAITIIYLIVKSALNIDDTAYILFRRSELDIIRLILNQTDGPEIGQENIKDVVESSVINLLNTTFIKDLRASLTGTFEGNEVLVNQFSGDNTCIELDVKNSIVKLGVIKNQLAVKSFIFKKKIVLKGIKQLRRIKHTDREIVVYFKNNDPESKNISAGDLVKEAVFDFYLDVASQISSVHYLPASRSGLYQALSAFGQIIAELSKNRSFLTRKIELPGISEPLSDYFIKLSTISVGKNLNLVINTPINEIAGQIEKEILRGKVTYDSRAKRLHFVPDNTNLKLDLSTTSSMVSELSPIVAYLRYVLQKPQKSRRFFPSEREKLPSKSMVIIEEPEAHLHPEVQIKLTEFFAALMGEGVKIFITSHSNYIFNKINNLILDKKIDINMIEASVFKMTDMGSEGIVLNIDELGIDDENFLDSAEQLYNEKAELIQKLNADV